MTYIGSSHQLNSVNTSKKIYRSRQPVTGSNGAVGYLDFWTSSSLKAKEAAAESEDRIYEELTLEQIQQMPPGSMARATAAWNKAYPND